MRGAGNMNVNRTYKASVFSSYFSDNERLIEVYNAIEDKSYPADTAIEINTLDDALFLDRQNDISFMLDGKLIILIEHQASLNKNMPLRLLMYVGRIYEKIIENSNVYREKLLTIPKPEFIVLYNGKEKLPDVDVLKLTDAFEISDAPDMLELEVSVYNINDGHNAKILKKSKSLQDYAFLVARVKESIANGISLDKAGTEAVKYCIKHDIMAEYLLKNGSEVENMLFTEFNMDDAKEIWYEEGMEDGIEKGIEQGIVEGKYEVARKYEVRRHPY
jgi:predicted transposase/invertase (TIGR01784 family)